MNWIKTILSRYAITVLITLLILFVLEGVSSVTYYQLKKPNGYAFSSAVEAIRRVLFPSNVSSHNEYVSHNEYDKLVIINKESDGEERLYPNYKYEPQFHHPSEFYYLANIANSRIIGCNEAGYFPYWKSDEFGYRNPAATHKSHSDILLIGDSFAEGDCENETGSLAGQLRTLGLKVANLGKGGSGPLHQLATLIEYAPEYRTHQIVWIVFTGNDLNNLREEKTSRLSAYLEDSYSQNLVKKSEEANTSIERFLETQIENSNVRMKRGLPLIRTKNYGESLDLLDAKNKEASLLTEVASRIFDEVKKLDAELKIVILNHIAYNHDIQDLTSKVIKEFAADREIDYLEITREHLRTNQHMYTKTGPHFSEEGNTAIGEKISAWLNNGGDKVF